MNGPNQQTFKVYAFIEVLTCAAGQLIKCIQFVEPLNFYDCSNGVLNFSHSAFFFVLFCDYSHCSSFNSNAKSNQSFTCFN